MSFMRGTIDEHGKFVEGHYDGLGRFRPTLYRRGPRGLLVMVHRSASGKVRRAEPCQVIRFRPQV